MGQPLPGGGRRWCGGGGGGGGGACGVFIIQYR